ncbi:MAG: hypothetical protein F6J95_022875 [Leptolyngbya sp. SIO1E4]|nr:hypothetical protein [Leptolyngbya sp. SIO1E4]
MSRNSDANGLTEAQRALLRKFPQLEADDPLVEIAAWVNSVESKLDRFDDKLDRFDSKLDLFGGSIAQWTIGLHKQAETVCDLAKQVVNLHSTLQQTARGNDAITNTLHNLKPAIDSLLKDSQSHRLSIAAQNDNFNHLSREMAQIESQTRQLNSLDERVMHRIAASSDEEWRRWIMAILAVSMMGILALGGFSYLQARQANHLSRLLNSTLIRLERIERAFGIQP